MRALALATALLLVACTDGDDGDHGGDHTADGGTTSDGGATSDGGSDAGTEQPCEDGATQDCTGSTEGSCTVGTRTCVEKKWSPCEGRRQPAPGACDFPNCADGGENPGCNCRVGTFRDCYEGPANTLGKGVCVKGFQECVATAGGSDWGACEGQVLPGTDDCSGRDLDCDAQEPASCACTNGQTRPCGGVTGGSCALGSQTCAGGQWGECVGAVQPVAGDCSQASCLGTPNPGCQCVIGGTEPCYTGLFGTETEGTCHAGIRTCDAAGNWGACAGQERPTTSCDLHLGPACHGEFSPGCE